MSAFFHTFFYQPILNALVFSYDAIPWNDFGISIIIITLLTRLVLYPLSKSALHSQKALQKIQPEIQKLREQSKKDPQKASREMMAVYKKHGVNPLVSFLPILVQFPVIIALYQALRFLFPSGEAVSPQVLSANLYSFVNNPASISTLSFFGLISLTSHSFVLAALAGLAQFWQSKLAFKNTTAPASKSSFSSAMNFQMRYFMPVMTFFIAQALPAGIALYWFATTLFSAGQQILVNRAFNQEPS